MEEKKPQHMPEPGLPEALFPEIGNGALWEEQTHLYLLRSPDPTKGIEHFLQEPQPAGLPDDTPHITVHESASGDVIHDQSGEEDVREVDILKTLVIDPPPIQSKEAEAHPLADPPQEDQKPEVKRKKKRKGSEKSFDERPEMGMEDPPIAGKTKAPKAGKLVRKAAKSIREREISQVREEKPGQEVVPETTLSPFTRWLKSLKGSDYVHPYDDDFALFQGKDSLKEGISETFADLLAAQGYKDQALEMYNKLIEKYPEKSGFFAAKIQALQ